MPLKQHFTDEQVDRVLAAYVERSPDAIERMHFVMRHPFRDHDEQMSRHARELHEVARTFEFFTEYAEREPSAAHHLHMVVGSKVAAMLGPIGTYQIEE